MYKMKNLLIVVPLQSSLWMIGQLSTMIQINDERINKKLSSGFKKIMLMAMDLFKVLTSVSKSF